jgi:hypothetical protein
MSARKGSSAFVEKPRDFSKKQKKRFKKKMFLKVENDKRSNAQGGGAANDLISQQLDLPETQELIETTGDRYACLIDRRHVAFEDRCINYLVASLWNLCSQSSSLFALAIHIAVC